MQKNPLRFYSQQKLSQHAEAVSEKLSPPPLFPLDVKGYVAACCLSNALN